MWPNHPPAALPGWRESSRESISRCASLRASVSTASASHSSNEWAGTSSSRGPKLSRSSLRADPKLQGKVAAAQEQVAERQPALRRGREGRCEWQCKPAAQASGSMWGTKPGSL